MTESLMTTHEVADYLRIKERKVYDLVAQRRIPCTRAAGKWLFPKTLIDQWLIQSAQGVPHKYTYAALPAIVGGSHDPLLDWAVRESNSGLAVLFNGSMNGLEHFAEQRVLGCGLHLLDTDSGDYNTALLEQRFATQPVVALEWAWREQGLIVPAGNRYGLNSIEHIVGKRFALRQQGAGSFILLNHLLQQAGLDLTVIKTSDSVLRSETEVAMAVANGQADVGLGVAAAAYALQLDFVPLARERYDLLLWRRHYFEPAIQTLLTFTQQSAFQQHAAALGGYDISELGKVRFNAAV